MTSCVGVCMYRVIVFSRKASGDDLKFMKGGV